MTAPTKTALKYVMETAPEDMMQGRKGETGIPHSDQWLERPKPVDGKMWKKNRKNILTDNNGRGVSSEILEEVYQARETRDDFLRQIHDSYYHDGR
jgi:hypothetical protein